MHAVRCHCWEIRPSARQSVFPIVQQHYPKLGPESCPIRADNVRLLSTCEPYIRPTDNRPPRNHAIPTDSFCLHYFPKT